MSNCPVTNPGDAIGSIQKWSTFDVVADSVTLASATIRLIYIERRGDLYRWSPAHRGGSYPLLRVVANFLGVDHFRIYLGFRTLADGTAIVCEDPHEIASPAASFLLESTEGRAATEIRELIQRRL